MTGFRWANSYWLTEGIFYLFYKYIGLFPLGIVFAVLAAIPFLLLGRGKKKPFLAGTLTFAAAVLAQPTMGIRPQVLTIFFIGLLLYLLRERKNAAFLPLLFLLWANLHAGFVLGLLLLGSVATVELLTKKNFKLFLFSVLSLLSSLLNPLGLGLWRTILRDASSPLVRSGILEWVPTTTRFDIGFFFLLYLFSFWATWFLVKRKDWTFFPPLFVFSFLALDAVRHVALFLLISLPFFVESLEKIKFAWLAPFFRGYLVSFFLIFIPVYILTLGRQNLDKYFTGETDFVSYPAAAVSFIKENNLPREIFNDYGWGGYLIWNLRDYPTFIDGRMPGWQTEDQKILEDYNKISGVRGPYEDLLQTYKVRTVLVNKETPLGWALRHSNSWKLVFEDDAAWVFVKE